MLSRPSIEVRFHSPPDDLRRYFTTFYVAEFHAAAGAPLCDSLQPEWANLRFFDGGTPINWTDSGMRVEGADFTATGPSTHACHFSMPRTRMWGIGFLPLGWDRFIARPAAEHANLIADGRRHPSFARFVPLADTLFGTSPDESGELDRIAAFFRSIPAHPAEQETRIIAIHEAIIDPQIDTVAKVAERVGMGQRTVERLCQRAFGFSPKVLLRRQRFMRSLAEFMLDPSLKWIGAIDGQYHDQAQFVRDFHEFMGTTPREYAARPHPVLERFMHERARIHGAAVQTLDSPEGAAHDPE